MSKKTGLLVAFLVLLGLLLAACQPETVQVEVTRVVESEVTRVITE
jgi:hypothetical protein